MNPAHHVLTLWTNDRRHACWADRAGVDRIGLDLETVGKHERQRGLPTWISPHTLDDLDWLRGVVSRATLFVRANPLHDGSVAEVEALVAAGVGVIMLPNFTHIEEVRDFNEIVAGRARVVPLVERLAAVQVIAGLPALGITEIHVGLNDLSIDLGERNRLAVLTLPVMDEIATLARAGGLGLGLGGLGRAMDDSLPVPSDLVYAQHARLGARGALIARSFFNAGMDEAGLAREIERMRGRLAEWQAASPAALQAARNGLACHAGAP